MFVFQKVWRVLLSCYLRFEIRSFALLPTSCEVGSKETGTKSNKVDAKLLRQQKYVFEFSLDPWVSQLCEKGLVSEA